MRSRSILAAAAPTMLFLFVGCTQPAPTNLPSNPATETYAASLNVNIAQMTHLNNDALYIQDSVVGTGATVNTTSNVTVKYSGWLKDGTLFDSSPTYGPNGLTQFILGWQEGLVGMKVGGSRKLVIGSALGYGAAGNGIISPNATLVFNVQMIAVQ